MNEEEGWGGKLSGVFVMYFTGWVTILVIYRSIHSFIYLIHVFIHPSNHSFIHPSIRSFIHVISLSGTGRRRTGLWWGGWTSGGQAANFHQLTPPHPIPVRVTFPPTNASPSFSHPSYLSTNESAPFLFPSELPSSPRICFVLTLQALFCLCKTYVVANAVI